MQVLGTITPFVAARWRVLLAGLTAIALVASGASVASAQANAEQQAQLEAAAAIALEETLVVHRTAALDSIKPVGQVLVDDATAWSASASPLLVPADVAALKSTADAVSASLARTPSPGASSDELDALYDSQWSMILGARERISTIVDRAIAAAAARLEATQHADSASRAALGSAMSSLRSAWNDHASVSESLTSMSSAAAAVTASHDAAVAAAAAAEAAAAAAAARRSSRSGGSGGSGVLGYVNAYRAAAGVGALSYSGALTGTSSDCVSRMVNNNSFTHSSYPGGWGAWAENIAKGYGSASAVVDAWYNSPGHRTNMLNPAYTHMGFAYVADGNWWCQQFGG